VFILEEDDTTAERQAEENERKLKKRKLQFIEVRRHINKNRN
jgi:hypothetical protein